MGDLKKARAALTRHQLDMRKMHAEKRIIMNINIDKLHCLIDLHVHLDGSVSTTMAKRLALINGIELNESEEDLKERLQVSKDCRDLNEYLEKFEFPLTLLQTAEAITECVRMLIAGQDSQGIMYSEIRFAPQLHMQKGLTQEEVVQAAIKGLGNSDYHKLILCCMRGSDNEELNKETIRIAHRYLGRGVVAK